jgi:beta-glucosidase
MKNRTYRFSAEKPLYPFGYGLSYTEFDYKNPVLVSANEDNVVCTVDITNTGNRAGTAKTQCYAHYTDSRTDTPHLQLCAVKPVYLNAGETETAELVIDKYWLKAVLESGERVNPDGGITLYFGDCQPEKDGIITSLKI